MRMFGTRQLLCGLVASLLFAGPVAAAQRCPTPAEQAVFDLEALKSELMVLAVACHSDTEYNAFVRRFQARLAENEHELSAYFQHTYGRRSQGEQDSYITTMANEQFNFGLKQGTDFCPRNMALFEEALAIESPTDLPLYAAAKELFPPNLGACAAPIVAAAERSKGSTRRTR
jgi:hypothetical protein